MGPQRILWRGLFAPQLEVKEGYRKANATLSIVDLYLFPILQFLLESHLILFLTFDEIKSSQGIVSTGLADLYSQLLIDFFITYASIYYLSMVEPDLETHGFLLLTPTLKRKIFLILPHKEIRHRESYIIFVISDPKN